MEWETPEFVEISLACEISSYANAELFVAVSVVSSDAPSSTKTNGRESVVVPPSRKTEDWTSPDLLH
jgi:coenzyme PQQ precursor peptide PqqA